MDCVYDNDPAIGLDLCHASHPVCDDHAFGHQIAPLPEPEPEPKRVPLRVTKE